MVSGKTFASMSVGLVVLCCVGFIMAIPTFETSGTICIGVALACAIIVGALNAFTSLDPRISCLFLIASGSLFAAGSLLTSEKLSPTIVYLVVLHMLNLSEERFSALHFRELLCCTLAITVTATGVFIFKLTDAPSTYIGLLCEPLILGVAVVALLINAWMAQHARRQQYSKQKLLKKLMDAQAKEKIEINQERKQLRQEVFVGFMEKVGAPIVQQDTFNLDSPLENAMSLLDQIKDDISLPKAAFDRIKEIYVLLASAKDVFSPDIEAAIEGKVDEETERYVFNLLLDEAPKNDSKKLDPIDKGQHKRKFSGVPGIIDNPTMKLEGQEESALRTVLTRTEDWDFDVFDICKITNNRPLLVIGLAMFKKYNLIEKFNISESKLSNFLKVIENGYQKMPYHNSSHAADVTRTVHYFLWVAGLKNKLSAEEIFATLVSSIIHDYDHPGTNNNYLINTGETRALLYNDKSVLENYHCAQAHILARKEENNIFANVDDQKALRKNIVEMVLATDLSKHFKLVGHFKTACSGGSLDMSKDESKLLVMKMAVKCGDLNHAAKPLRLHEIWTRKVTEEFYRQGDLERGAGIQVSPFMDRNNANLPKSQTGFMQFLVNPMYEEFMKFLDPDEKLPILPNLKSNHDHWKTLVSTAKTPRTPLSTVEKVDKFEKVETAEKTKDSIE
jgi:hypothetical protein